MLCNLFRTSGFPALLLPPVNVREGFRLWEEELENGTNAIAAKYFEIGPNLLNFLISRTFWECKTFLVKDFKKYNLKKKIIILLHYL